MARILIPDTAFRPSKKTKPVKRRNYTAWVRTLPCLVTHRSPVEFAHLSTANLQYGHLGRGKSTKADDSWGNPLVSALHYWQGNRDGERKFWIEAGINPYVSSLVLFRLHATLDEEEARTVATQLIMTEQIGRVGVLEAWQ